MERFEIIDTSDPEYQTINNEIVCAEFWQFCKTNGLNFHRLRIYAWKELPETEHNIVQEHEERKLLGEAMMCFNLLKQRYTLHKGKVHAFRFNDSSGSFSHKSYEVTDFLNQVSDHLIKELAWEKQCKRMALLTSACAIIAAIIFILYISVRFDLDISSSKPKTLLFIIAIIGSSYCINRIVEYVFIRMPIREIERINIHNNKLLENLKRKLTTIQDKYYKP